MILQLFSGPEGAGRVNGVTVEEAYRLVRRRRRLLGLDYVVVLRFALLALLSTVKYLRALTFDASGFLEFRPSTFTLTSVLDSHNSFLVGFGVF